MKPVANSSQREMGLNVARLLTGAWRPVPTKPDLSENELAAIEPLLCQSGAGAFGWWRVRDTPLADSEGGRTLHENYRRFRLSALIHEREIEYVLALLRAEGIEAVLVKGWAVARLYPDRALRPYGDMDLCVRPSQFARAKAALKCLEEIEGHYVDLHDGFDDIGMDTSARRNLRSARPRRSRRYKFATSYLFSKVPAAITIHEVTRNNAKSVSETSCDFVDRACLAREPAAMRSRQDSRYGDTKSTEGWDELFRRSQLVSLGDEQVRVLSDEDHLRILCLHLLRSGAWRPPWLCDVALLVESRSSDFDWDLCLGRDPLHADWVACAIGLAHQLLCVEVKDTPVAARAQNLPRWLMPAVLRQWGRERIRGSSPTPGSPAGQPGWGGAVSEGSRSTTGRDSDRVAAALRNLYTRWDNPVRATAAVHGQFSNWPRLPYRVAESIMRSPELPKHLVRIVRPAGFKPASNLQPLVSE